MEGSSPANACPAWTKLKKISPGRTRLRSSGATMDGRNSGMADGLHRDLWASSGSSNQAEDSCEIGHKFAAFARAPLAHVDIISKLRQIMFFVRCTQVSCSSRYSARPFSQLRPSNGFTEMDSMVSLSMQRTLTLTPSGCERGM